MERKWENKTRYPKGNETLNVEDLLSPIRTEDRGNELWKIFNVIQEKLIKHFLEDPPDIFIGIDAPDFNLFLEKKPLSLKIE